MAQSHNNKSKPLYHNKKLRLIGSPHFFFHCKVNDDLRFSQNN